MGRVIQYIHAPDGTRIACWTLGSGKPLVYLAGGPWNHIELWDVPQCRAWSERLARHRMLVRYDVRGTGMSERKVTDFSLDAYIGDLEAVVEGLGLKEIDLFAAGDAGPVAISYAVQHPERVSRIIFWCAWAKGTDFEITPRIQAWRGLIDKDWELMTETCAHLAFGWDAGPIGRQAAEGFKASISRENAQLALETTVSSDVTHLLPKLGQPALVLHRNAVSWLPVDIAMQLASGIPNSRLGIVEGETTAPYLGDSEGIALMIEEFLEGGEGVTTARTRNEAEPIEADRTRVSEPAGLIISAEQRNTAVVELLPLLLRDGGIYRYQHETLESWQVAFEPSRHPGDVARSELTRLKCEPKVIHSTSWRIQDDRLVLTYAAVLSGGGLRDGFREVRVQPLSLARGTATDAPQDIGIEQVVEHALRHLAWLAREDEPVRSALGADWEEALSPYNPEPFSAFDISGALSEEDGCLLCTRFSRPLSEFASSQHTHSG